MPEYPEAPPGFNRVPRKFYLYRWVNPNQQPRANLVRFCEHRDGSVLLPPLTDVYVENVTLREILDTLPGGGGGGGDQTDIVQISGGQFNLSKEPVLPVIGGAQTGKFIFEDTEQAPSAGQGHFTRSGQTCTVTDGSLVEGTWLAVHYVYQTPRASAELDTVDGTNVDLNALFAVKVLPSNTNSAFTTSGTPVDINVKNAKGTDITMNAVNVPAGQSKNLVDFGSGWEETE